ncbi:MAG: gliding motility-associated C-terminal domain-containing protein [Bacteroidia bacterium]|nr:gliding motility-associated C-terminal domain-containing protein [Bacteroidia bacterium]
MGQKSSMILLRRFSATLLVLVFAFSLGLSQNNLLLFNEDFNSSSNTAILNTTGVGTNSGINTWIVNNDYSGFGTYPNTTNQNNTAAGTITNPNAGYLHIHDLTQASNTANAIYNNTNASDRFVVINSGICTKSFSNVRLSFYYTAEGDANDYFEVYYRANGGPWKKTGQAQYNAQTLWKYELINDPGFSNVQNLEFGFRWKNDATGGANTISVGIDDIYVVADYIPSSVSINITNVPTQVCQGLNIPLTFTLSDTLCSGQYLVELFKGSTPAAGVLPASLNLGGNTTTISMVYNVGQVNLPVDPCYRFRITRTSPPPVIVSQFSACFAIVACPNTINTVQPAVTMDQDLSNLNINTALCVGSVIDVPFWSTGTFQPNNVYTAQLSDQNGSFTNPLTLGTLPSGLAYDPLVVPSPGSVSGIVPPTVDGCGYYIRVISNNPNTTGSVFGPICVKNCDIETNNKQDIHLCVGQFTGDQDTITFTINNPLLAQSYNAGNQFLVDVHDPKTFAQVNAPGTIGSVTGTTGGQIIISLPAFPALTQAPYFLKDGLWYIRVIATNATDMNNVAGTLIRMTIGAPYDNNPTMFVLPDTACHGEVIVVIPSPYNMNSSYQYYLNGAPQFVGQPWGFLFNQGAAGGTWNITYQETNNGCLGPLVGPSTVYLLTPPTSFIIGPQIVCNGDTVQYALPFQPNTAYGWSVNPPQAGSILVNGNDKVRIVWDSTYQGVATIDLYASNKCGSVNTSLNITINPAPIVDAGADQVVCLGQSVTLGGNPTISGGQFPFQYAWTPSTGLSANNQANPTATPIDTITYHLLVTDNNQCQVRDSVTLYLTNSIDLSLAVDTLKCQNESVVLDPMYSGPAQLVWSTGDTANTIVATDAGLYWVEIVDAGGNCTGRDTIIVNNKVQALPYIGPDTSICGTEHVLDAGLDSVDYVWNDNLTDTNRTTVVNRTGTYWVKTSNECGVGYDTIYVIIIDEKEGYLLPNVFSPNGDGFNDVLKTETGVPVENYRFYLFDRWGQKIFESKSHTTWWDGNLPNGKPAAEGVYFYVVTAVNCKGELIETPMHVTLVR